MSRFTVDYANVPKDTTVKRKASRKEGYKILYLLEMTIDGVDVVKIGITSQDIKLRVLGILDSHYNAYRYFPYCKPKRFTSTACAEEKEAILLKYFSSRRYHAAKAFGGHTELVAVPIQEVVEAYDLVMRDKLVLS